MAPMQQSKGNFKEPNKWAAIFFLDFFPVFFGNFFPFFGV